MQDPIDGVLKQIPIVADDHHGPRIARQVILQPERPLEIEIVGGLVEQQQVGLGEQDCCQCKAHSPAAGKFAAGRC